MFFEAAQDRRVVGIACTVACVDDDVEGGKIMLMQPERFPDQTLDAIASHGAADDACCDRQSEPGSRSAVRPDEDGEQRIGETFRILVDAIEVRFVMKTLRRGERPGGCLQERKSNDGDAGGRQTVRRLRPLARRRDSTRRPARVAMRARKP